MALTYRGIGRDPEVARRFEELKEVLGIASGEKLITYLILNFQDVSEKAKEAEENQKRLERVVLKTMHLERLRAFLRQESRILNSYITDVLPQKGPLRK